MPALDVPTPTCMQNLAPTLSSMMSMRKMPLLLLTKWLKVNTSLSMSLHRSLRTFYTTFSAGGKAVVAVCSAEDGDKIVQIALEKFGGVHVLVANAGVIRDKSFQAMTEQEWDDVLAVHLRYSLSSLFPEYLLTII